MDYIHNPNTKYNFGIASVECTVYSVEYRVV